MYGITFKEVMDEIEDRIKEKFEGDYWQERCKAELIVRSMKHKVFNKDGSAKKNDNKFVYSGKKTFGYFCPKCKRWG